MWVSNRRIVSETIYNIKQMRPEKYFKSIARQIYAWAFDYHRINRTMKGSPYSWVYQRALGLKTNTYMYIGVTIKSNITARAKLRSENIDILRLKRRFLVSIVIKGRRTPPPFSYLRLSFQLDFNSEQCLTPSL